MGSAKRRRDPIVSELAALLREPSRLSHGGAQTKEVVHGAYRGLGW